MSNVNKSKLYTSFRSSDVHSSCAIFLKDSNIFDENGRLKESAIKILDDTNLPICYRKEDLKPGTTRDQLIDKLIEFKKKYGNVELKKGSVKENKNLVHADSMTEEEVDKELNSYSIKIDNLSFDIKKVILMQVRKKRNLADEGSDVLDYKIGTYSQGEQYTCTILSSIRNLSEEDVKKILKIEKDSDGKIKGCTVVFPGDKEKKPVFLSIDEIKKGKFDANGMTFNGFCEGDLTARAIEMAYLKRFSENNVEFEETKDGYTIKFPNDRESIKISKEEVKRRNVEIDGKTYTIETDKSSPEIIAYQIAYAKKHNIPPVKGGLASQYWIAKDKNNNGKTMGLDPNYATNLFLDKEKKAYLIKSITENDLKYNMYKGSVIGLDDEKIENINNFMICSNGSIIAPGHGYSFVKYDEATKMVYVSDPASTTTIIPIPLADVSKYMFSSGIRIFA